MEVTLYARALNGKIKVWSAENHQSFITIRYGYFGGNLITTHVDITMASAQSQFKSTINKKRKEGYKDINEIVGLNYLTNPSITEINEGWFQKYLPNTNLDDNYNLKPMKCQKFKKGKMKYPAIAQPKYNGVRAVLRWEHFIEGEGFFKRETARAVIRSKSGLEYHFPHITNHLDKIDFIDKESGIQVAYDGELYLHNTPLNVINSGCPLINDKGTVAKTSNPTVYKNIVFMIFDVAVEDIIQANRLTILAKQDFQHLSKLIPSISRIVMSDDEVARYTLECISNGYEGCVIRNQEAEYAFGSRPMTIMKSKELFDGEFEVIDIIPKPRESETGLFVLRNDINDNTFECNPMGTYVERKRYLDNKQNYIGKMATVKYYERSGVKQVPFPGNVVTIRDYE